MSYYEVWVASPTFHGNKPLTYSSDTKLESGTTVLVPLQRIMVVAVVIKEVSKPSFATKALQTLPVTNILPLQSLELITWLTNYYPSPSGYIASLFLPSSLAQKSRDESSNTEEPIHSKTKLPPLTDEQKLAIEAIHSNDNSSVLLHGDTGSGKTRVYVELAKSVLAANKSVIVLTPEIGLTPQLEQTFSEQFKDRVHIIHSHLTPAMKRKSWQAVAKSGEQPLIILGTRSALFSPVHNLGLVIIDEMHDSAYKQEQAPYYQATRVAAQLARLHKATLVLGSATPTVSDYFAFEAKKLPIVRMTKLAKDNKHPAVVTHIVNIRERDHFARSAWLSDTLLNETALALNEGSQTLLFLNRRGSARAVLCQACGWQALCPKCDIPLTYHGDQHSLRCHTCGYKTSAPSACPTCKATDIIFKTAGTKAIVEEVQRQFPNARIARFDSDNTKVERLDQNHQKLLDGEIDILVGTQMLTKGLDLPRLSVVGVISADTALSFPDYTAEEISYQQLTQVVGRVGRGHRPGIVIIQTHYPTNSAIEAIVNKNYSLFYQQQISERERFLFPPFSYILKLSCARKTSAGAEKAAYALLDFLRTLPLSLELIGPAPSFIEKKNDQYRWQVIVKTKKRDQLVSIIKQLPSNVFYDIDPTNLL